MALKRASLGQVHSHEECESVQHQSFLAFGRSAGHQIADDREVTVEHRNRNVPCCFHSRVWLNRDENGQRRKRREVPCRVTLEGLF